MIRSAWPFSASRRSPLVSVSANSTLTTSSLIIVLAFVGPRPVYSRNTPTASFEISAVDGLPAGCSSIRTLSPFPRTGCRPREGKETMESHQQRPRRTPPPRQRVRRLMDGRPVHWGGGRAVCVLSSRDGWAVGSWCGGEDRRDSNRVDDR